MKRRIIVVAEKIVGKARAKGKLLNLARIRTGLFFTD